jgi:AAA ATPase domain
MNSNLAFVGRAELLNQLADAYRAGQHLLVLGPKGIGKTALLGAFFENRARIFCDVSAPLSQMFHALESSLAIKPERMNLLARKRGLLASLATGDKPVVFDHVSKTSPQLARFMSHVAEKRPVWIGCRSDSRHEVGHIWQYLFRFKRIEVPPFSLRETTHLLREAVRIEKIQPDAIVHARKLRTLSGGNPGILIELVNQLKEHHYELQSSAGLHLLELDKRINSYRTQCF